MSSSGCSVCFQMKAQIDKVSATAISCAAHNDLCNICAGKWITENVESGKGLVKCHQNHRCSQLFSPTGCRELVKTEVFSKWCDLMCEYAIRGYERCHCPNNECRELILDECEGPSSGPRKITCPHCRKGCCFKCAGAWDDNGQNGEHRCDEVHVFIEATDWKRCPGCKNYVELEDGCEHIICRCETEFCYDCGGKIENETCACSQENYV